MVASPIHNLVSPTAIDMSFNGVLSDGPYWISVRNSVLFLLEVPASNYDRGFGDIVQCKKSDQPRRASTSTAVEFAIYSMKRVLEFFSMRSHLCRQRQGPYDLYA